MPLPVVVTSPLLLPLAIAPPLSAALPLKVEPETVSVSTFSLVAMAVNVMPSGVSAHGWVVGYLQAMAMALPLRSPLSIAPPLPPDELPVNVARSADHRLGISICEGESVTTVRDVVEGAMGRFADSEYYEMTVGGSGVGALA